MWSIFSRDPTKDFAYEQHEVVWQNDRSLWILHKGKKKSSSETVSIFRYEQKPNEDSYMELAKNAVKRLKTLRHPSILTYIDSLETDKSILVVTEYVEPLHVYLENLSNLTHQQKEFAISWGLLSVSKGLSFINNDCNMIHGNLSLCSIFVNSASDWKISNFEYLTNIEDYFPFKTFYPHKLYTPPELTDSNQRLNKNIDSWGLGCLIWEIFNGFLSDNQKLKTVEKIPKKAASIYVHLVNNNCRSRCSIQDFIQKGTNNGYFKNAFIDTMLFLEEIQIKDQTEKNRFFSNLNKSLESFPVDVTKNKILPLIVTSLEYGEASTNTLELLFKIGKLLNESEYQKRIVPCIIKLYSAKDRSVRSKLLKEIEEYVELIPANVINEQIFRQLLGGFMDSNPVIREQTVKSIFHIAPKLNTSNLNEDVMKHFNMIQTKDPEGGIRTNTIVCLGKIAGHLQPQTRQNFMLPAFMRSLRDPFPSARIAGVLSLSATQNFFTLQDCTKKIMPNLCLILMDPEKQVRDHAFTALKSFISKLEKYSENPALIEQMESEINTSGSNVSSKLTSGLSWAVSSLAAKLTRTKIEESGDNSTVNRIGNLPSARSVPVSKETNNNASSKVEEKPVEISNNDEFGGAADGWEDDWQDSVLSEFADDKSSDTSYNSLGKSTTHNSLKLETKTIDDDWNGGGWDFEDIKVPEPKPKPIEPTLSERPNRTAARPRNTAIGSKPARGPMKLGAQKLRKNN